MDEMRFQRVEKEVVKHGSKLEEHTALHREHDRRLTDQGHIIGGHAAQIQAQAELILAVQKSTVAQNKMIEIGENIIEALTVLGRVARWILSIAALCTMLVASIKAFLHLDA